MPGVEIAASLTSAHSAPAAALFWLKSCGLDPADCHPIEDFARGSPAIAEAA